MLYQKKIINIEVFKEIFQVTYSFVKNEKKDYQNSMIDIEQLIVTTLIVSCNNVDLQQKSMCSISILSRTQVNFWIKIIRLSR